MDGSCGLSFIRDFCHSGIKFDLLDKLSRRLRNIGTWFMAFLNHTNVQLNEFILEFLNFAPFLSLNMPKMAFQFFRRSNHAWAGGQRGQGGQPHSYFQNRVSVRSDIWGNGENRKYRATSVSVVKKKEKKINMRIIYVFRPSAQASAIGKLEK